MNFISIFKYSTEMFEDIHYLNLLQRITADLYVWRGGVGGESFIKFCTEGKNDMSVYLIFFLCIRVGAEKSNSFNMKEANEMIELK